MKQTVTDLNVRLNRKQIFQVEIDGEWCDIFAPDFFDYLCAKGTIDGHDPQCDQAWTAYDGGYWSYQREEYREKYRYETRPYEEWLLEIDDEDYLEYVKLSAGMELAEAA